MTPPQPITAHLVVAGVGLQELHVGLGEPLLARLVPHLTLSEGCFVLPRILDIYLDSRYLSNI